MTKFKLYPVPPFRLDLTAWVLRRVPGNMMDQWDGQAYCRVLVVDGKPVEASLVQKGTPEAPYITVTLAGPGAVISNKPEVARILTKMLGLDVDLSGFYQLAHSDARLSALADRFSGFKPPRFSSIFETLVNGIACQQISLIVGITLLNRLSAAYGLAVGERHAFPRPVDLADASVEDLRALGFSGRKAGNILAISRSVVEGQLDLDALEQMDNDRAVSTLCGIYGVGRWTAEYVVLRGLGRLDMYPADDVGSQNKLQNWLEMSERPNYQGVHQAVDRWSPYRGLIYFHLLLDSQEQRGLLSPSQPAESESSQGSR